MTYNESRYVFISELASQVSPVTGEQLYDYNGKLTRMAERGEFKERIESELSKDLLYNENVEKMKSGPETADPMEKYMIDGFAEFYDSLQKLENPENPVSARNWIAELLLESYPQAEKAAEMVKSSATPSEVLKELENVPAWNQDAMEYLTRGDVELPTSRQKSRWVKFETMTDHINDLAYYS